MKLKDLVSVEDCLWPTEGLALLASARHTSLNALDDDVPLKLSHSTKDSEDHFAHECRGINGLVEADELDTEGLELFQSKNAGEGITATPWKARPHGRFEKLEKFCGSRDGSRDHLLSGHTLYNRPTIG